MDIFLDSSTVTHLITILYIPFEYISSNIFLVGIHHIF